MTRGSPRLGRALVLGGGIGGLTAARVLARHFDEVVVAERDSYSGDRELVRLHTPHGAHAHILLAGGLVALSRLVPELPGWFDELGFPEGDLTYHTRVAFKGRWLPRARSGIPIRTCTRSSVEHLLRRAVHERGNIRVLDACTVVGLVGEGRVEGARLKRDDVEEVVGADLVVDATGRASSTLAWLRSAGVPEIEEEVVDAGIVYWSCWYEAPEDLDDDWTVLATLPAIPDDARMGVVIRFPSGPMLCSLVHYGRPSAPRTHDELLERFAELRAPQIYDVLRASTPSSEILAFGNTANRWRRFGRAPWFPDGLVVIGDAACSLNPRYGQGMTVAVLGVERLERELVAHLEARGSLDDFSHRFQRRMERVLSTPWQIALLEDRAWVTTVEGARLTEVQRWVVGLSQRLLETAFTDVDTYITFMRVAQLLGSPLSILSPRFLAAVARGPLGGAGREDIPGTRARSALSAG